jgi:hypothetical protein
MAQLTTNPRGLLTLTDSLLTQVEPSEAVPLAAVTGNRAAAWWCQDVTRSRSLNT